MRSITQLSVSVLVLFSLASCGSSSNNSSGDTGDSALQITTQTIGAAGGTVKSSDGLLTLTVPADALTDDVEISISRANADATDLMTFEMLPAGTEFALPVNISVDVSALAFDNATATLKAAPVILSTDRAVADVEVLENQLLSIDLESGESTLTGDLSHFSRFVIGGNIARRSRLEGVAQFGAANTPFGPVKFLMEEVGLFTNLESISYTDESIAPVFYTGINPTTIVKTTATNDVITADFPYSCGDPGVGTYAATISFVFTENELVSNFTPGAVNIASAFMLGTLDGYFEDDTGGTTLRMKRDYYRFKVSRQVNCGGSAPVDMTGNSTDAPATDPNPGDNTGGGTTGPGPLLISTSSGPIIIDHVIGQTACPTPGQPIRILSDSPNPVNFSVNNPATFLSIDNSTGTVANGPFEFTPAFTCENFTVGSNTNKITVTAIDSVTGVESNSIDFDLNITVNNP